MLVTWSVRICYRTCSQLIPAPCSHQLFLSPPTPFAVITQCVSLQQIHIQLCHIMEQHSTFATCDSQVLHMPCPPQEHTRQSVHAQWWVCRLSGPQPKKQSPKCQGVEPHCLKNAFCSFMCCLPSFGEKVSLRLQNKNRSMNRQWQVRNPYNTLPSAFPGSSQKSNQFIKSSPLQAMETEAQWGKFLLSAFPHK